jgi:DNA-binding MltR family transcriptional regulator
MNKVIYILKKIKNLFIKSNNLHKESSIEDKKEKIETFNKGIEDIIKNHPDKEMAQKALKSINEFKDFRTSLLTESDRGSVLMAAAFIEDKITQLLETYMVQNNTIQKKIFEGNGALATFSSKIDISFLLGLIPKNVYNDLGVLRKLRNDFAHNAKAITFQTEYIKDRCTSFSVVAKTGLRDDTRAYFLRSMTTILTCINMKMDSFERCQEEDEFNTTNIDAGMKSAADILKD